MLRKALTPIPDDTEEAPWMVMGTPQFDAAMFFYMALRNELRSGDSDLFVAGMMPIRHYPIPGGTVETLSPDVLMAPVPIIEEETRAREVEMRARLLAEARA